jgi:Domain of unknown function (DUF4328)
MTQDGFRSGRPLAVATTVLGAIGAGCIALDLITTLLRQGGRQELAASSLALLHALVFLAGAIVFLCWVYRATSNLPALGSMSVRMSPSSAVWGFFIPIVNLVRPYQALKDLWTESRPAEINDSGFALVQRAPLVGWWWGTWIASRLTNIVSITTSRLYDDGDSRPFQLLLLASLLNLVATILWIKMVRRIDQMQTEQHDKLRAAAYRAPPVFGSMYRG